MTNQKTLEKLKEESSTVYSAALLIRNLYLFFTGLIVLAAAAGILFSGKLEAMLQADGSSVLANLVGSLMFHHPLTSSGTFNLPLFIFGCLSTIAQYSLSAYIFHSVVQVFKSIRGGQSPFTKKNAGYWKKCYRIYAVIAVLCFLSSIILRGATIFLILPPLLAACFFSSLALIFEYGSYLQQESDETL